MYTRFFLKTINPAHSMRNVYGWNLIVAAAAMAMAIFVPAPVSAQSPADMVAINQPARVSYTECASYTCSSATYTPDEVVHKISPQQRSAIINKDCKGLRSEFGKNLEAFPFEFRDTLLIDCIDDRQIRLWMTENNYRRFLANKDSVTSVAEYHEYLRSVGYTSRKLAGQ